jgi:endonuclease/exonuclease/phosphatase family metal-dependent hydrolase
MVPDQVQVGVATYNLMAESTAPSFASRLSPLIEAISSTSLATSSNRILCLQEVNDELLPLVLAEPFIQRTFPFSTHIPSSLLPSHRNLVTLASIPFQYHLLQFTERHKTALIVSFFDHPLQVANVHLTSALSNQAVQVKNIQMETLTKFLSENRNAIGEETLIAGDFNLTTSSSTIETALSRKIITPETAQLVRRVVDPDIWEDTFNMFHEHISDPEDEIFEGEEGATFDRLTNHLAAMSESPIDNRPQRYDRILHRKGGSIHVESFEIFGLPNKQGSCASDHYGVFVKLELGHDVNVYLNAPFPLSDTSSLRPGSIEVVEDSTDLRHLLEPYLPTISDQEERLQALGRLQHALTSNQSTADLVLAPLGSYFMDTYFADSDVDVLTIGSVPPHVFFDIATTQLRALDTGGESGFKGVHFVNSLVPVVEVCVLGIKFDLQYCQAAELVRRCVISLLLLF